MDRDQEPRTYLEQFRGTVIQVEGVFDHFGRRAGGDGGRIHTALFQDLTHEANVICAHMHVQNTENLIAYSPRRGDRIRFQGLVMSYRRRLALVREDGTGYVTDWCLWDPRNISVLNRVVKLPSLIEPGDRGEDGGGYQEPGQEGPGQGQPQQDRPPGTPEPAPPTPTSAAPPRPDKAPLAREVEEVGRRYGWEAVARLCDLIETAGGPAQVRKAVQSLRD